MKYSLFSNWFLYVPLWTVLTLRQNSQRGTLVKNSWETLIYYNTGGRDFYPYRFYLFFYNVKYFTQQKTSST